MAGTSMVEQVRDGMQVRSLDGKRIGKVRLVHTREAEVYVEVAPRSFRRFWGMEPKPLFLPASAVAEVAGRQVTLNIDATGARSCTRRPLWIPDINRDVAATS